MSRTATIREFLMLHIDKVARCDGASRHEQAVNFLLWNKEFALHETGIDEQMLELFTLQERFSELGDGSSP